MRSKINHRATFRFDNSPSNLYRAFAQHFQRLLSQRPPTLLQGDAHLAYVSNPDLEERLSALLEGGLDGCAFLVGATGIGKSTYIRHCFGTEQNPRLSADGRLFIPFHLNGMRIRSHTVEKMVIGKLRAAIAVCGDNGLQGPTDEELGEFIRSHRADLLERDLGIVEDAPLSVKVRGLRNSEPYVYLAERLKWALTRRSIARVVLVIDDVESQPYDVQRTLLEDLLKFQTCLENLGAAGRPYSTLVIMSCRPMTARMLRAEPSIIAYPLEPPIWILNPVSIGDLFTVRHTAGTQVTPAVQQGTGSTPAQPPSPNDFSAAFGVLKDISSKVNFSKGDAIVRLHNNNIRDAMKEFVQVLSNSRWFEVSGAHEGAFTLAQSNYRTTEAGILQAIGLRNANIFDGDSSPLANLFHNTADPRSDLVLAHIARYFLFYAVHVDPVQEALRVSDVVGSVAELLDLDDSENLVDSLVRFAHTHKLLDIDERQSDAGRVEFAVATPRLAELWHLLGKSSLLMQLWRDDTYLTESARGGSRDCNTATSDLRQADLFTAVFDFWDALAAREVAILRSRRAAGQLPDYVKYFGPSSLSEHALFGIGSSIERYFQEQDGHRMVPSIVDERLASAKGTLEEINDILQGSKE